MKNPICFSSAATALLLITAGTFAQATPQLNIQPSDPDAKPFVAQGSQITQLRATDKSSQRVLLKLDAAAKTAVFTEFASTEKGELDRLRVSSLKPAELRPLGEYGTRIEEEVNDYFGGTVHVLVLACAGTNTDCVAEQDYNSVNGEAADKAERTFFKAHFKTKADAQRTLEALLALR